MKKISIYSLIFLAAFSGKAQNASVADMQQDMAIIQSQLGQIKLELEEMRRNNAALAEKVRKLDSGSGAIEGMNIQIAGLRTEMIAKDEANRKEILAQVKKELEALTKQVDSAISKMANAINKRPQADLPPTFSDNFPKNGVSYTVKSGDTLSKIASQNKSRIKWIQDANKITDPNRGLRIGEVIFVPQE